MTIKVSALSLVLILICSLFVSPKHIQQNTQATPQIESSISQKSKAAIQTSANNIAKQGIKTKAVKPKETMAKYTEEEIAMICTVVQHEVGNCETESKIAVTNLILNRVKHKDFPNNIADVLTADGQFTAIHHYYQGDINVTPCTKSAVESAISGEDNSKEALYYYAPQYVNDRETINWFESLEFLFELEGQRYFK